MNPIIDYDESPIVDSDGTINHYRNGKVWKRERRLFYITYPDDNQYQIHWKPTHPDYDAENLAANVTRYSKGGGE